jgi:hypothetical protein
MENNELQVATAQNYQLEFKGQGSAFFGILIVNWILTVLTLGFYYPWARAKQLQSLGLQPRLWITLPGQILNWDEATTHGQVPAKWKLKLFAVKI